MQNADEMEKDLLFFELLSYRRGNICHLFLNNRGNRASFEEKANTIVDTKQQLPSLPAQRNEEQSKTALLQQEF